MGNWEQPSRAEAAGMAAGSGAAAPHPDPDTSASINLRNFQWEEDYLSIGEFCLHLDRRNVSKDAFHL